jgi:hypothetical protein
MLRVDLPEQSVHDDVIAEPPCVALVSTAEPVSRSSTLAQLSRPDPSFLTHLLATAEQVPQTRNHRRAEQADALSAYRAYRPHVPQTGFRTRQVI